MTSDLKRGRPANVRPPLDPPLQSLEPKILGTEDGMYVLTRSEEETHFLMLCLQNTYVFIPSIHYTSNSLMTSFQ